MEIATSNGVILKIEIKHDDELNIPGRTINKGAKDLAKIFKTHTSKLFQERFFQQLSAISEDILPDDTLKINRIREILEGGE